MICRSIHCQKVHQIEDSQNKTNLELENAKAKKLNGSPNVGGCIFGYRNLQRRRRQCCLLKMALRPFVKEQNVEKKQIKECKEDWADEEKPEGAKKSVQVLRGIALALQSKPGNYYQQFL